VTFCRSLILLMLAVAVVGPSWGQSSDAIWQGVALREVRTEIASLRVVLVASVWVLVLSLWVMFGIVFNARRRGSL
jgi:hypothetical protein